jgi:hypothetical protein
MHRFVKWPKYVRIQRQRRVLHQRLKVPPSLARFAKTLDRNAAEAVLKLLLKYRPEDRAAKKARLLAEAEARAAGKEPEKKKPVVVKFGLNHITTLIEQVRSSLSSCNRWMRVAGSVRGCGVERAAGERRLGGSSGVVGRSGRGTPHPPAPPPSAASVPRR